MAESNSILNGEAVSLRRGVVGTWVGDGSYTDVVNLYGSVNLTANVTTVSAQRYGDGGKLLATYARITGGTMTLEWAGDMTSLGVIFGMDIANYGDAPDLIRALRFYAKGLPYFGFLGASDTEDGTSMAVHFFAPKCQVNADTIQIHSVGGGQEAEFRTISMEVIILPDDNYVEGAENEVQNLALGSPNTGNYTLALGPYETAAIAHDDTASDIEDALEALPVVGAGNVTVVDDTDFIITFTGDLAGQPLPLLIATPDGAFDGTLTVTRVTKGVEGFDMFAALYEVAGGTTPYLPPLFTI